MPRHIAPRWQEDQAELRREAYEKRRALQLRLSGLEDDKGHRKVLNHEQYRRIADARDALLAQFRP